VDAQPSIDGEQAGVEGHIVGGTGSQAVTHIKPLAVCAVPPWLDVAGQKHALAAERRGVQAAEHTLTAAVSQHLPGENVLPDPRRSHQNPFGIKLRQLACICVPDDPIAEVRFEHRDVEFLLAEQNQLAAIF